MLDFLTREPAPALGYVKVAAATPVTRVGDCQRNGEGVIDLMRRAADDGAALVAFPELCLTGYTLEDLLTHPFVAREAETALDNVMAMTATVPVAAVVGLPVVVADKLYNCAAVIEGGRLAGVVPKTHLPNNGEFYERRWFTPGDRCAADTTTLCGQTTPFGTDLIFAARHDGEAGKVPPLRFAIELCEDLWVANPPSTAAALRGAQLIVNISASNEYVSKDAYRRSLVTQQSARCICGYLYTSAGYGESTKDLVFGGAQYIAENGTLLAAGQRYQTRATLTTADLDLVKLQALRAANASFDAGDRRHGAPRTVSLTLRDDQQPEAVTRAYDPHPFVPADDTRRQECCEEVFSIQTLGLARRLEACGNAKAVIGVSGGLDSTLALLVAARTMDLLGRPRTDVVGITMPGFGTTNRTHSNANALMRELQVTAVEIDIRAACRQHFADIGLPDDDRSTTYENSQARERTQLLMDYAGRVGGLVVGTGDLSELALGWATYNGDHMSMYGVNAGIPKTLVRYVVDYVARTAVHKQAADILADIVATPISPELLPGDNGNDIAQRTEDLVGPYELHDFFLYHFMRFGYSPRRLLFMAGRAFAGRYDEETIKKWLRTFLRRFFSQQYKRSAMPDGPKVGLVSLSPRGDWRMPSDMSAAMWLREADEL